MEKLINEILKNGGRKETLEVKIFGGGKILSQLTAIGEKNIDFVIEFLQKEQLEIAAQDVGGALPRKVYYFPESGKAQVRKLKRLKNDTVVRREHEYLDTLVKKPVRGEVDLFE